MTILKLNDGIHIMNSLFFELIQVAIGTQNTLSRPPSACEWKELYNMAKKQSLVGICFAGLQKLYNSVNQEPSTQNPQPNSTQNQEPITQNLNEVQYLIWMGMAAKIQQRNEVVNRQCVEVQKLLRADGFRSSILKGQGIASLYNGTLTNLRQSGDIDIFIEGGMNKTLKWCRKKYGKVEFDYINAHVPLYNNTEVEVHWRVQAMTNLFANRTLQKWLESEDVKSMMVGGKARLANGGEIVVPTKEFNAFYILLHCYHHMFESGLGLRQLMDYYFVLVAYAKRELPQINREFDVNTLFAEFGMKKFASAVMWIMLHVFGMEDRYLLCEPDEKEGRFILNEVMQNGNFGHHDERVKKVGSGKMSELWRNVQHNWHLASHYPSEFFWQPVWLAYHFAWKRFGKH